MSKQYETVIGLEVHVELATKTKIFCGCSTAFGGAPNTHTCPVCTGMPGSLPVLNKKVVEYAAAVGLATNCTITKNCKFDRKNYFYPDNPQNYQISQLYLPICRNGHVDIELEDGTKKAIRIHEIHMEEDAGKLVHDDWEDVSYVDYNRSGVPLIEIVSEPDMRSAEEVIAYLEKLRLIIQYLGASDCKLQEGSMRADVNLSVREVGAEEFGTRTETKNLNSFSAIARAIEAEKNRQIDLIESGEKLVHDDWEDVSYVDYNRSGVPLIEIVSEPDMRSAEEVIAYLEKLRLIIQYLGASDCKLQEGSMRADVNLSVREVGAEEFGTRTETKNLNSFSAIARAIEAEKNRQIDLIESGEKVVQETRRWDDNKAYSYAMRSKEDAQDYRYFPDPDLVPLNISDEWLDEIRSRQPEFKTEKMARYAEEYGIPEYDIGLITDSKKLADIFEATTAICNQPKKVSNWILGETMRILKDRSLDPEDIKFSPENLAKLIALVEAGTINGNVAKDVFAVIFDEDVDPESYVKEHGLGQVNDEGELRSTIEKIIADNPQSVADYRSGKEKAMGFLVGQTMKAMKGKANPGMVNKILKELL